MNKKIESLANIWANRRREEEGLGIVYVFSEKALQVFADKIVEECATVVDDNTVDTGSGVAAGWCEGKDLLKHFGVEE